jgi:hypothetical protein
MQIFIHIKPISVMITVPGIMPMIKNKINNTILTVNFLLEKHLNLYFL